MAHIWIPLTCYVVSLTWMCSLDELLQHALVVASLYLAVRAMRRKDT